MGNTEGNNQKHTPRIQASQLYTNLPKISHPKFSHAKIVQDSNYPGGGYILLPLSIPNRSTYQDWQQRINLLKIKQKYLPLMLPKQFQFKEQGLCGSAGTLKVKYDLYSLMLSDQVQNRRQTNLHFEQPQIWYLIYTYVQTAALIHEKGYTLGDVRPQTAFINENGEIFLGNMCTFLQQQTNYNKSRINRQTTFLAPQVLKQIKNGEDPKSNLRIAQCFSIGLTILDAFNLSDSNDLYGTDLTFQQNKLSQRLRNMNISNIGNRVIKGIISSLCHTDPVKRVSCKYIYEFLQPYEQQILNLSNFTIDKIQQQVQHRIFSSWQYIKNSNQRLKSFESSLPNSRTKRQSNKVIVWKDSITQANNNERNMIISSQQNNNFSYKNQYPNRQPWHIENLHGASEASKKPILNGGVLEYQKMRDRQFKNYKNQSQSNYQNRAISHQNQLYNNFSSENFSPSYVGSSNFGNYNFNSNVKFPQRHQIAEYAQVNYPSTYQYNSQNYRKDQTSVRLVNGSSETPKQVSQIPFQYGSNIPSELLFDQQKYNSIDHTENTAIYNTGEQFDYFHKKQKTYSNQYKTNPSSYKNSLLNQWLEQKDEVSSGRMPVNLSNQTERYYATKNDKMAFSLQNSQQINQNAYKINEELQKIRANGNKSIPKVQHKHGMLQQMGRHTTSINPYNQKAMEISHICRDDSRGKFTQYQAAIKDAQLKISSSRKMFPHLQ